MSTDNILSIVALAVALVSPVFCTGLAYFGFRILTEWRLSALETQVKDKAATLARIDKSVACILQKLGIQAPEDIQA